ncbi:MAG: FAD-binding protein, partial [Gammaproteobacteria bacterium]
MFVDARSVDRDKVLEADVCIVGAGAAGITLARECINSPFRVILLESGGLKYDKCLTPARSRG